MQKSIAHGTHSKKKKNILGFSVKSGKHGTSTLSLVQNRVRFKKNLQKGTLALSTGGVKLRNAPLLVPN